jgi:CO/xanthine dehydrogenase Mo-binding subunit
LIGRFGEFEPVSLREDGRIPETTIKSRPSRSKVETGDAEAALAAATHKVDVTYGTPRYNHNAIELHAATFWNDDEDRKPTSSDSTTALGVKKKPSK